MPIFVMYVTNGIFSSFKKNLLSKSPTSQSIRQLPAYSILLPAGLLRNFETAILVITYAKTLDNPLTTSEPVSNIHHAPVMFSFQLARVKSMVFPVIIEPVLYISSRKKGLVNGLETILNASAASKLNCKNLFIKSTRGIPNPNVGNTLINVPIAAPQAISDVLDRDLANFRKNNFSFLTKSVLFISVLHSKTFVGNIGDNDQTKPEQTISKPVGQPRECS